MYKMSLKHFTVPEIELVLKLTNGGGVNISNGRGMSRGHRYQMKKFPVAKYKTICATHAHSHTIVLKHKPKYKMNMGDE